MNIKPSALHEIYADLLRDRMEWAEGAIDKLGKEADNDVTGSVKACLSTGLLLGQHSGGKKNTIQLGCGKGY